MRQPEQLLAAIYELCQRYAHPGVNAGGHELARKIMQMIEKEQEAGK